MKLLQWKEFQLRLEHNLGQERRSCSSSRESECQSAITAIETNLGVSSIKQQTSIINAIVALLNSIPAPASSTSTPLLSSPYSFTAI